MFQEVDRLAQTVIRVDLYSGRNRFESDLRHRLATRFSCYSSDISDEFWDL